MSRGFLFGEIVMREFIEAFGYVGLLLLGGIVILGATFTVIVGLVAMAAPLVCSLQ